MTLGIDTEIQPSEPPRVLVTVTGLDTLGDPVALVNVVRIDDQGAIVEPVRGGRAVLEPTDANLLLTDTAAPFGRPVYYVATVTLDDGTILQATSTPALTLIVELPWLSEPITGNAVAVTVKEWPVLESDTPASVIVVDGRADPVVVSSVATLPGSNTVLRTSSLTDLRALRALVGSGDPLLLRATCVGVEDAYLTVGKRAERRVTNNGADERRNVDLDVQHLAIPAPDVPAVGDTLEDLADAYPSPDTLADLDTDYPTLLDLARTYLGAL